MHHDQVDMPTVMKLRRQALDLTQPELAKLVGIGTRQIARYESGAQQPAFNVAIRIADALRITVDQLAGRSDQANSMQGTWWATWQIATEEKQHYASRRLTATQHSERVTLEATDDSNGAAETQPPWTGELKLLGLNAWTGWFISYAADHEVRGSIFLNSKENQEMLSGHWVGDLDRHDNLSGRFILSRSKATGLLAIAI